MSIVRTPVRIGPQQVWDWSRTYIFGVVNVTPDSFSDGGRYQSVEAAVARGVELVAQGADALDIGGESTRPGAEPVTDDEELSRVLPVIRELAARVDVPLSVDTYKAAVAHAAVEAGASIVNDVSGFGLDPAMVEAVAETGASVIIGHLRGEPATMKRGIHFDDVVAEVVDELRAAVRSAVTGGVAADRIWIDPGIGFGKRAEHSLALLQATARLRDELGYPLMVGVSRKSFIGDVTGLPVDQRLIGTCAATAVVAAAGADAVRLHDVGELRPAVQIADAIRRASSTPPEVTPLRGAPPAPAEVHQ